VGKKKWSGEEKDTVWGEKELTMVELGIA